MASPQVGAAPVVEPVSSPVEPGPLLDAGPVVGTASPVLDELDESSGGVVSVSVVSVDSSGSTGAALHAPNRREAASRSSSLARGEHRLISP